jgi:GntR family transcriptional regulator, transcriptional repressor for pyruvate dehydrogenase complex
VFAPLSPRESTVDACVAELRGAILSGELAPGTRLPPERKLAESFGVNRVTVRSALARLSAARLLAVRQGSGYVVQDYRRVGGTELLPGLAEVLAKPRDVAALVGDLLLVRRSLARAVLEKLASASPAGIASVRDAVDSLEAAVSSGVDATVLATLDMDILAAMLRATGSDVLALCFNPVAAIVNEMPELRDAMYAEPAGNVAAYRVLLAWMEQPSTGGLDLILKELARRDGITLERLSARGRGKSRSQNGRDRTRRRTS